MKKIFFSMLLLLGSLAWAQGPSPDCQNFFGGTSPLLTWREPSDKVRQVACVEPGNNPRMVFPSGFITVGASFGFGPTIAYHAAGSSSIAAAATTVVVANPNVSANSSILVTFDEGLSTKLSVTCNSAAASEAATYFVSARTAGVSFTVKTNVAPTTNPACFNYILEN